MMKRKFQYMIGALVYKLFGLRDWQRGLQKIYMSSGVDMLANHLLGMQTPVLAYTYVRALNTPSSRGSYTSGRNYQTGSHEVNL